MKNNIRNIFSVLLSRIINKPVFGKVVIIFIVGFASRLFINNININNIFFRLL